MHVCPLMLMITRHVECDCGVTCLNPFSPPTLSFAAADARERPQRGSTRMKWTHTRAKSGNRNEEINATAREITRHKNELRGERGGDEGRRGVKVKGGGEGGVRSGIRL